MNELGQFHLRGVCANMNSWKLKIAQYVNRLSRRTGKAQSFALLSASSRLKRKLRKIARIAEMLSRLSHQ